MVTKVGTSYRSPYVHTPVHNQPSCKDHIVLGIPKHEPGVPWCLNLVDARLRREMGEMGHNAHEQHLKVNAGKEKGTAWLNASHPGQHALCDLCI